MRIVDLKRETRIEHVRNVTELKLTLKDLIDHNW